MLLAPTSGTDLIGYADLTLPPITLWEQRAAMIKLRVDGDNAPAQAKMFEAVLDQRALVDQANGLKGNRHQGRLDVRSGSAKCEPVGEGLATHPIKIREGRVWLRFA